MLAIDSDCGRPADTAPLRPYPRALELILNKILRRIVFYCQIRVHILQVREFGFHFLQTFQIRRLHASVPRFPVVVHRIADSTALADLLHGHPGFRLLKNRNGFRFSESADFFITASLQWSPARKLQPQVVSNQGEFTTHALADTS